MSKRATIMDVAAAAGVSIKTVSRVFNREPNVRESTAEKVHAAAQKLHYSPNLSARRLASNRSFLVGLVYDNPSGSNSFITDIQDGVLATFKRSHYELVIHPTDANTPDIEQQLFELVETLHLDGLILLPPFSDDSRLLNAIKNRGIQCSRISQSFAGRFRPCVSVDDEDAAFGVTRYLIELGHERIGFIKGHPQHGCSDDRMRGYQAALAKYGTPLRKTLIRQGDFSFESGYREGMALLRLKNPPTAIFASNDDMAAGVLVAAHESGIAVPDQLSICGYDDITIAHQTWPPLTTVRQPIKQLAETAAQLLIDTLNGQAAKTQVLMHSELIVRASTAAPA